MDEQFIYTQLDTSDKRSFRILELQPGDKEAPIVCNLIHARLDAQPAYEAISYVWGSSETPISIDCDGKRLNITENLRDALVRVRLPDRPRNVWADSVCIDQKNDDEKGHQVQFMGKIYSNASRVLICLGNDDEGHAQRAMSLVEDLGNMIAKCLSECEQTGDRFPYLAPDDPWFKDDRWPAYSSLASRPWFGRGWVLQEAALAQDAVVLWGDAECSWNSFMDTQLWSGLRGRTLEGHEHHATAYIHRLLHVSMGGHSMRLRPLILKTGYSENLSVPEFMAATRYLHLSKPVDRVFAFLAVLDNMSQTALNIKADYSKAPQSVYTEFAVAYLQATRDLNLLQWVQHTNESLELGTPSWVPLWDIDQWMSMPDLVSARKQDHVAHSTLERGINPPRLTVQALLFDTIRFASDEDVQAVQNRVQSQTEGRRFVVTDRKCYYGLVPRVAKEADVCAFLRGAWTAFTLRETENVQEYRILGDAFFVTNDIWRLEEAAPIYKELIRTDPTVETNFEEHAITLV